MPCQGAVYNPVPQTCCIVSIVPESIFHEGKAIFLNKVSKENMYCRYVLLNNSPQNKHGLKCNPWCIPQKAKLCEEYKAFSRAYISILCLYKHDKHTILVPCKIWKVKQQGSVLPSWNKGHCPRAPLTTSFFQTTITPQMYLIFLRPCDIQLELYVMHHVSCLGSKRSLIKKRSHWIPQAPPSQFCIFKKPSCICSFMEYIHSHSSKTAWFFLKIQSFKILILFFCLIFFINKFHLRNFT